MLLQPMTCQCLLSRPLTLKRRTTEIFQELESNGQRLAADAERWPPREVNSHCVLLVAVLMIMHHRKILGALDI